MTNNGGVISDYIDAYHVALMERRRTTEVLSYDKHFDRLEGIKRREPE